MSYYTRLCDFGLEIQPPLRKDHRAILESLKTQKLLRDHPDYKCQWEIFEYNRGSWLAAPDESANADADFDWLRYIAQELLGPWGYEVQGKIRWQGDENDDRGIVYAEGNQVEAVEDTITNKGPSWRR
jgi:hypothetical protein